MWGCCCTTFFSHVAEFLFYKQAGGQVAGFWTRVELPDSACIWPLRISTSIVLPSIGIVLVHLQSILNNQRFSWVSLHLVALKGRTHFIMSVLLKKGDRFPWPAFIAQGVTGRETEFQMYSTADDLAELYPEISLLARIGRDITFTPIGESSATKFSMCNDLPISCHCFCTSTCHLKNWSFNPKSTPRSFSQVESGFYQSRDMPGSISWQSVGK